MEKIKGLAIDLDLDHMSVDRGLKGLKDRIKSVNAEMRANMSAFDRSDRSVQKYQTRLDGLNKKLEVQKRAVEEARKEYEQMVKEYGHGSKEAEKAAREYNNQAAALNNLERYIEKTKEELQKLEREQRIANSGWTKLGDKLEKASNKLKTASEKMGQVGSTLTNKITKPALGAATALASLALYKGFQRLIGIDTARAKLEALGHDAKNVETIMNNALDAVRGTAYGLDEAATSAASAVAAGIRPGRELHKYLTLVGDAAAIANTDFNEMSSIFNKVQTAGRAYTGELNQLADRGIPIFQWLAKEAGKSAEEVRKMATKGEISAEMFRKAIDKNIGGAAKTIGEKSFAAAMRNIGADIARIGANFLDAGGKGKGFFTTIKPLLVDFRRLLARVEDKSADLGVKFGRSFERMIDKVKDLKRQYDSLSPAQQEFINKVLLIGPAVAVGIGPALQGFSKLTAGVSGVLDITSRLSKAIGIAKSGAGLTAALSALGPGAIAGVAVAGLGAVAVGAYTLYRRAEKAKEVNLDLAESFSNQATQLEESAKTFEKLSEKAKISNAELAELNDLNIRISQSSNPGEIQELQRQYDELAKKSGLSKDELEKLFQANKNLVEQSPDVEKSISEQGNAFVENTDAIYKQIEALRKLSEQSLKGERAKLLEQEAEARQAIIDKTKELEKVEERLSFMYENQEMSKDEISKRVAEINELIKQGNLTEEEAWVLDQQRTDLLNIKNGRIAETVEKLQEELQGIQKNIDAEQEKLDKLDAVNMRMADIYLANVGINEEGEKGLVALDKAIAKNSEELLSLEEKRQKTGELTEEERIRHAELAETVNKQREAKDLIFEELGIYQSLNSLAEHKLSLADTETQKRVESLAKASEIKIEEGNIVKQIQNKNSEIDKSISKLEKEREKQGANKEEINKQIKDLENKKELNEAVIEQILKELGVWEDVKDTINIGTQREKEKGNAVDETKKKLDSQGRQIDINNQKTDVGIKKEEQRTREAGKDVSKNVNVTDKGTIANIDKKASAPKNKTVNLKESGLAALNKLASSTVTKKVSLSASWSNLGTAMSTLASRVGSTLRNVKFWEKGTPPSGHPGGHAIVGERGSELIKLPDGRSFLSPGTHTFIPNLPKGTHVIPHQETKRIIRNAPSYASGTRNWPAALGGSEFARLLALNSRITNGNIVSTTSNNTSDEQLITLLIEQNEHLKKSNELLTALLGKDLDLYKLNRKVDEGLNDLGNRRNAAWGGA